MKNKTEYDYPETDFSHYTYEVGRYLPYECDSEEDMQSKYDTLIEMGYKCKTSTL